MAKAGVYKIQSLIKPDRIYIGSSNNIHRRWNEHLREMKSNTHHSSKLKNHVSKYGVVDLQFSILLECGSQDLLTREQDFIDALNPYFNECKIAGCPGAWNKGMNLSKEHCDNLSKSHIGNVAWNKGMPALNKGVPMTEDQKEKIRQTKIGENNPMFGKSPSGETREKMSIAHKKYWELKKRSNG
jgi:group I intron endonuclease